MGRILAIAVLGVLVSCGPAESWAQSGQPQREAKVLKDATWLHTTLNNYWAAELNRLYGLRFEPVSRVLYYQGGNDEASCGGAQASVAKNAFYCNIDSDEHIAFDLDWFQGYLVKHPGGATTFLILAHEFGHAVQDAWLENNGGNNGTDTWNPAFRRELNADCLAGAFLAAAYREGWVREDTDDADALWNWLYSTGSPWLDPKSHGTHEQRVAAFTDGWGQGTHDCRVRY